MIRLMIDLLLIRKSIKLIQNPIKLIFNGYYLVIVRKNFQFIQFHGFNASEPIYFFMKTIHRLM